MEKQSCACTVIIQLSICFALYCVLNVGQPQNPIYRHGSQSRPNEFYFISVRGGFRPLKLQTHLLKQMEKVVNVYKVGFVVNISELGEDDPLLQNATLYFHSLKAPWYTTRALRGQESDYFVKRIHISNGKTLDLIALNTGSLQDFSSGDGNVQLQWLSRTLEASNSDWHIAVGFHPLLGCEQNTEQMETKGIFDSLHDILLQYGVNAYLSGQSCADLTGGGPYFTTLSQGSFPHKKMVNTFLLHRISPLEIVTYAVTFGGDIVHKFSIKQRGREVM